MNFQKITTEESKSINGGSLELAAAIIFIASEAYSAYEGYQDAKAGVYNPDGRPGQ